MVGKNKNNNPLRNNKGSHGASNKSIQENRLEYNGKVLATKHKES